jgi:hypothetical protein
MSDMESSPTSWGDVKLNDNINNIISSLDCEAAAAQDETEFPATQPVDQRVLKGYYSLIHHC